MHDTKKKRSLSTLIQIFLVQCYYSHVRPYTLRTSIKCWQMNSDSQSRNYTFLSVASLYTDLPCDTVDIDLVQDV